MRGIDRLTSFRWCYSFCDAIRLHGIFRIIHSDENKSDWFFSEATEKKSKHFLSRSLHVSGALQSIESAHIPSFIHFRLLFIHHINCNTYTYTGFISEAAKMLLTNVFPLSSLSSSIQHFTHCENIENMLKICKQCLMHGNHLSSVCFGYSKKKRRDTRHESERMTKRRAKMCNVCVCAARTPSAKHFIWYLFFFLLLLLLVSSRSLQSTWTWLNVTSSQCVIFKHSMRNAIRMQYYLKLLKVFSSFFRLCICKQHVCRLLLLIVTSCIMYMQFKCLFSNSQLNFFSSSLSLVNNLNVSWKKVIDYWKQFFLQQLINHFC